MLWRRSTADRRGGPCDADVQPADSRWRAPQLPLAGRPPPRRSGRGGGSRRRPRWRWPRGGRRTLPPPRQTRFPQTRSRLPPRRSARSADSSRSTGWRTPRIAGNTDRHRWLAACLQAAPPTPRRAGSRPSARWRRSARRRSVAGRRHGRAEAAIQMSFVGIGLPSRRRSTTICA